MENSASEKREDKYQDDVSGVDLDNIQPSRIRRAIWGLPEGYSEGGLNN